jgi:phage-related protein (TIGR01555 family)
MNRKARRAEQRMAAIATASKTHLPPMNVVDIGAGREAARAAADTAGAAAASIFGLQGAAAMDAFSNLAARMGAGSASVAEGVEYQMVRWSNDYWLMVTLFRNHWLVRRTIENPARDMVKCWPSITGEIPPEDERLIRRALKRTKVQPAVRTGLKWGGLFGGGGSLMVIKGHEDILDEPLDLDDVQPGSFAGLITFDRWSGIIPAAQVGADPADPTTFGLPLYYQVQTQGFDGTSFNVHPSRILRWPGAEVPNPENAATLWWGISEVEPVFDELRKRDNASWSMLNLMFRANIMGIRDPELAQVLSGAGMGMQGLKNYNSRMQAFNEMLSNQSTVMIGKDGEMFNNSMSFAGIAETYQQFQLDYSGAARQPISRLFGRIITGLGNNGESDEKLYEERIASDCDEKLDPALHQLYPVVMMSELGEVLDDFDLSYPSVRVMTEKEKAELMKDGSAAIVELWGNGGLTKKQFLREIKSLSVTTGIGESITDEDIDAAPDKYIDELGGQIGEIGGGDEEEGDENGN